jgi:hypothetical protein
MQGIILTGPSIRVGFIVRAPLLLKKISAGCSSTSFCTLSVKSVGDSLSAPSRPGAPPVLVKSADVKLVAVSFWPGAPSAIVESDPTDTDDVRRADFDGRLSDSLLVGCGDCGFK